MDAERIGFPVAVFVAVGVGVGAVVVATTGWAEAAFAAAAGGDAERFGPVFVAQLYLSVTAAALVGAPVLAGMLGVLIGSRSYGAGEAAVTAGLGTGVGAIAYGLVVVALAVGSQGSVAEQAYGFPDALGSIAAAGLASAVVGAVAGVLGSRVG